MKFYIQLLSIQNCDTIHIFVCPKSAFICITNNYTYNAQINLFTIFYIVVNTCFVIKLLGEALIKVIDI